MTQHKTLFKMLDKSYNLVYVDYQDSLSDDKLSIPVTVADDTARFALTSPPITAGQMVQVTATGNNYVVVDIAELDNEDGYVILPPAGPAQVIVRQGTAAEIAVITLASGEFGYATDTKYIYMGDGATVGGVLISANSLVVQKDSISSSGTNQGGSGTVGAAGSSVSKLNIRGGNGGNNNATGSSNGGSGGALSANPITVAGGLGGNAGTSGNGGAGGAVGGNPSAISIQGGIGGSGSSTGTGAGGVGGAVAGFIVSPATSSQAIGIVGGNGGVGAGNFDGGSGGAAGRIIMNGGAGGTASGATGGAGGAAGTIFTNGSSASGTTAGAAGGSINTIANGNRAGGYINTSAGASAAGGSIDISNSGIIIKTGTGSPETVVTAVVGSLFLRTDGGANTTLYIKESGTGNTGWIAK